MVTEERLWEGIRARVRNAGLQIATFEELEPLLISPKVSLDDVMRDKGFPSFITNIPLDDFVADQLDGCKKIKAEYGNDVCITEVALDCYGNDVPNYVGIYTKSRDIPFCREARSALQRVRAELEEVNSSGQR